MESESEPLLQNTSKQAKPRYDGKGSERKDSGCSISTISSDISSDSNGSTSNSTGSEDGGGDEGESDNCGDKWKKFLFCLDVGNFLLSTFMAGLSNSVFSPFYTKDATDKGLDVWQSGVVFFIGYMTQIVFMPIFGKFIVRLGSQRIFVAGLFISGLGNLVFGCLRWAIHPKLFFSLSLTVMSLSSVGYSALLSAVYPLATGAVSRRYRASMLSVLETSFGVGMMTGPSFGGFLYDLGGFNLPFFVVGCLLIFSSCLTLALVTGRRRYNRRTPQTVPISIDQSTKYKQLFKDPAIAACFAIVIVSEMSVAWVLPTFERFLSLNFNLNASFTGIIFSLEGITYAIFTPVIGWLLDRGLPKYIGLIFGSVAAVIGLTLIGPMPGLESVVPKSPYTSAVGLSIVGTGVAATFITTLTCMLSSGSKVAPDSEQTRSMITSMWMIAEILGTSFGTLFGGMAYDAMGFENGLLVVAGIQVLTFALVPLTSTCLMKKLTENNNVLKTTQHPQHISVTT